MREHFPVHKFAVEPQIFSVKIQEERIFKKLKFDCIVVVGEVFLTLC